MVIAMRRTYRLEGTPAVAAPHETYVRRIHNIFILRIHEYLGIVPGTLADVVVAAGQRPGFTSVVRQVQATVCIFNNGLHFFGVGRRYGHPYDAPHPFRQSFSGCDVRPGFATIGAFPKPASLRSEEHTSEL